MTDNVFNTWQPIATAPKDGGKVIVFDAEWDIQIARYDDHVDKWISGGDLWSDEDLHLAKVVYWMPLPDHPMKPGTFLPETLQRRDRHFMGQP